MGGVCSFQFHFAPRFGTRERAADDDLFTAPFSSYKSNGKVSGVVPVSEAEYLSCEYNCSVSHFQ